MRMFFENETISFNILDVVSLDQKNVNTFNSGRNYSALSFRFSADAVIKTEKNEYKMKDNYVSYVPARVDYTRTAKHDELVAVHFDSTNYNSRKIECFEPKDSKALADLFRKILDIWNEKEIGYKLRCSAILYEIFAECYAQNYSQKNTSSKIQPSIDYINVNYVKSDLSIKEIADKSFMSEVYFRKLFKEEYGTSPQKYIISKRIQHAAGLISTGYYSLKEVSTMSGYADYKYFSVEFKKAMGVSPSEYWYNYK